MFIQQVSEIKVDPMIIEKYQKISSKPNAKTRDFLKLLKCYKQNNDIKGIDSTINNINLKFCLTQNTWIQQIDGLFKCWQAKQRQVQQMKKWCSNGTQNHNSQIEEANSFPVEKVIQIALRGLLDGQYFLVGKKIIQFSICLLKQNKLKINFVVSIGQRLISMFVHNIKKGGFFISKLREIYSLSGNVDKIRQCFKRQIKEGYQNIDLTYDLYKDWQQQMNKVNDTCKQIINQRSNKMMQIYKASKMKWQIQNQYYQQKQIQLMNPKTSLQIIDEQSDFYKDKYIQLLNKLDSNIQKLWFMRRVMLQRGQLIKQYMLLLQKTYQNNEDQQRKIKKQYNILCQKYQQCQILYLQYLVRRISKHFHQQQIEQYENKWSDRVVQFRDVIKQFIEKHQKIINQKVNYVQLYYNYWVQVETKIIQSVQSVTQLYEAILKEPYSRTSTTKLVEYYIQYSKALIFLKSYKNAKYVLKRACQVSLYCQQSINAYSNFLSIYGQVNDWQQLQIMKKKCVNKSALNNIKQYHAHSNIHNLNLNHFHHSSFKSLHADQVKMTYDQLPFDIHSTANNSTTKINKNISNLLNFNNQKKQSQKQIQNKKENIKQKQEEIGPIDKPISIIIPTVLTSRNQQSKTKKNNIENNNNKSDKEAIQLEKKLQDAQKKRYHSDTGKTIFIQNIPQHWKEKQVLDILVQCKNVEEVRIMTKNNHNHCYVQFNTIQNAQKQCKNNKSNFKLVISRPPNQYDQSKTLFLCGLPLTVTEIKIRQMLKDYQSSIKEIRIKSKDSKHHAYVDFIDEDSKKFAFQELSTRKLLIDNKKIFIQQCDSDRMKSKKFLKIIFIKNLAFKAKQKDLINFFSPKQIKKVYIPKNEKDNKSKGIAYVQFEKFKDFQQALDLKHGSICGREFSIFKSDRQINKEGDQDFKSKQQDKNKGNQYFSNLFS